MRLAFFARVLLVILAASGAHAIGKATIDPNATPRVASSTAAGQADARLSKKITYSSGEKRLHDVADELTELTGVTIRTGYNANDWHVRDIPLVVAARGLTLGRLLKAIAESTHTLLTSKALEGEKPTYRFYRTTRMQQEIDGYLRSQHETALADAAWAWDAMLAFSKSEAAQKEAGSRDVILARLLSTLGADAKKKVLAGESIYIGADGSQSGLIRDLQMAQWKAANTPEHPVKEPTQEQVDASVLTIKLVDGGEGGHVEVYAALEPLISNPCMIGLRLAALMHRLDKAKELNLPARPDSAYTTGEAAQPPAPDLELMSSTKIDEPIPEVKARDWTKTKLDVDVNLPLPKKRYPTYADKYIAIADATGVSIVAEDFFSHRCSDWEDISGRFGHKAKACDLLKDPQCTWFLSRDSDLLVGWSLSGRFWHITHANLVPESLIDRILAKLDTEVELDDVTPLAALTLGQWSEWVTSDPRLRWLVTAFTRERAIWAFYDALAPDDKKLARREAGLPLGKFEPPLVGRFLRSFRRSGTIPSPPPRRRGEQEAAPGTAKPCRAADAGHACEE